VSKLSPYEINTALSIYEGKKLYAYIDGGADIFFEYGFYRVLTQNYRYHDESIIVDIYDMIDTNAAFGIYSIQQDPSLPPLGCGDGGILSDFHAEGFII